MKKAILFLLFIFTIPQPIHAKKEIIATGIETGWQCIKIGTGIYLICNGIPLIVMGTTGIIGMASLSTLPDAPAGLTLLGFGYSSLIGGAGTGISYAGYRLTSSGLEGLNNLYEIKEQESDLSDFAFADTSK